MDRGVSSDFSLDPLPTRQLLMVQVTDIEFVVAIVIIVVFFIALPPPQMRLVSCHGSHFVRETRRSEGRKMRGLCLYRVNPGQRVPAIDMTSNNCYEETFHKSFVTVTHPWKLITTAAGCARPGENF